MLLEKVPPLLFHFFPKKEAEDVYKRQELTNMAVLTEEVGELARVMARKYGDQSFKEEYKNNKYCD